MYERIVWTHPVKRRFKTQVSLLGTVLTQELSGVQHQETILSGATHQEYAEAVEEQASSQFLEGLDASASPTFRHGYESFNVNISGSRKIPARGGLSSEARTEDYAGSYQYYPEEAQI